MKYFRYMWIGRSLDGKRSEMLRKMKAVCDWALLADIMDGKAAISAAKVNQYDQHKKDLRLLKEIIRK